MSYDDWTPEFFTEVILDLWRRAVSSEGTEEEADFLEDELGVEPGARVLDIACGNGRLAIALAKRGYQVEGLDQAEGYLAEGRAEAKTLGLSVILRQGDMRRMSDIPEWEGTFDGAYCIGNSFPYFDAAGVEDFFAGVAHALKPGGCLILDTDLTAESVLPDLDDRAWEPVGEWMLLVEKAYHAAEGRMDATYTIISGEGDSVARTTRTASYWIFTVGELTRMMSEAGLEVEALYADRSGTPFEVGDAKLILTARKRI